MAYQGEARKTSQFHKLLMKDELGLKETFSGWSLWRFMSFALNWFFLARKACKNSVGFDAAVVKGGGADAFNTKFLRCSLSLAKPGSLSDFSLYDLSIESWSLSMVFIKTWSFLKTFWSGLEIDSSDSVSNWITVFCPFAHEGWFAPPIHLCCSTPRVQNWSDLLPVTQMAKLKDMDKNGHSGRKLRWVLLFVSLIS